MYVSQQILQDFQQGKIESLYLELFPSLLRYAERVLGPDFAFEAEDCVQEAIFKVYQERREFRDPLHMRAFLFTCVHNEIVSIHRKHQTHAKYASRQQDQFEDTIFDNLVLQETLDRLYAAIDALPVNLRQIFDLSFEQGLQNIEIAQMLSLSPETIKKRKAKMINILRDKFKGDEQMLLLITLIAI